MARRETNKEVRAREWAEKYRMSEMFSSTIRGGENKYETFDERSQMMRILTYD